MHKSIKVRKARPEGKGSELRFDPVQATFHTVSSEN